MAVRDRQQRTTTYTYDAVRNLIKVTDPLGRQTKFGYYENQRLRSLTDPKGNVTTWNIDLENRVRAKRYGNDPPTIQTYEGSTSRLKSVTDALGQIKRYSYAVDNRLTQIRYENVVNPTPNVRFTYDGFLPRMTSLVDGSGTTQYRYQPIGSAGALRLAQEDGPSQNDALAYHYDELGRVSDMSVGQSSESFAYDAIGRIVSHTSDLGVFSLTYLGQTDQLTGRHLANGVGTDWAYESNDRDRRLKGIINSGATRGYQYTTTPEGLISQNIETGTAGGASPLKSWTYSYDDASRLLRAESTSGVLHAYSYDAADNITSMQSPAGATKVNFNHLNQINKFNGQTFSYDANGNLLDDGQRTFQWDAENRLVGIRYKANPSRRHIFRYDGFGRRIAIVSIFRTNPTETRYLWCGEVLCQARTAGDTVTRRYFAEGAVQPATDQRLHYATDHLGSVRDVVVTADGERVASYDYDPYGNSSHSNAAISTDFRYAGMFFHQESGLYLTHYRVYDPTNGRWLSRDPMQENMGLNLYAYVEDSPTNYIDPNGTGGIGSAQWCASMAAKIKALEHSIGRQKYNLSVDPLNLPDTCPGDTAKPSLSRSSHRMTLYMYKANLAVTKQLYAANCIGRQRPPVSTPIPVPTLAPPVPSPQPAAPTTDDETSEYELDWALIGTGAAIGAGFLLAPEVAVSGLVGGLIFGF